MNIQWSNHKLQYTLKEFDGDDEIGHTLKWLLNSQSATKFLDPNSATKGTT